ncbi:MAG TPA: tetratricopeptide repeat protein, partial [Chthoniobacterales bacterium]|nr:tetratricopeptide repeat protein [Chthoniobacterales bacterium]
DWWPLQRFALRNARSAIGQLVLEKIPFLLLSAASCPVTIWAQKDIVRSLEQIGFPLRVGNALTSYLTYIGKMFYPVGLAALYPYPEKGVVLWKVMVSVLFLLLVSVGVVAGWRKHPYLLTGWLWYLGMLVPVIGLMQVGNQAMADRYTYLPQIGLYIMMAWGCVDFFGSRRYRRSLLGTCAATIVVILLVVAHVQATYWRNGITIMTHAIACTSDNFIAYDNLGVVLATQGHLPEAIEQYERSLQINPRFFAAHDNLAVALSNQGKIGEAIEHYERALQSKPKDAETHNNLANVLVPQGKIIEAIEHYERAIQLKPDYFDAHYNLGNALANQGKMVEATQQYEQAIQIKPDHAEAHNNLANVLVNQGKMVEAIEHYKRAIQIRPDYFEAHFNLGNTLATQGNLAEAIGEYDRAIQIRPDYVYAHFSLANTLARQGDLAEAVQHFQKALDLATAQKNDELAAMIRRRLESYELPLREIPSPP